MSQQRGIPPVSVVFDEFFHLFARPKQFKSGSSGWYGNEKATIQGERCQVNVCITIIGSKAKGGTLYDEGEKVQGEGKRSVGPQEGVCLEDGSEVIRVDEVPSEATPAGKKRHWLRKS